MSSCELVWLIAIQCLLWICAWGNYYEKSNVSLLNLAWLKKLSTKMVNIAYMAQVKGQHKINVQCFRCKESRHIAARNFVILAWSVILLKMVVCDLRIDKIKDLLQHQSLHLQWVLLSLLNWSTRWLCVLSLFSVFKVRLIPSLLSFQSYD